MYTGLPPDSVTELNLLIEKIMQLKQNLVELAVAAGSSNICRTCGGECCLHGKYHVSVLDVLAYLKNNGELIVPDFSSSPDCPYSGISGCTMAPGYRPMTCVVFNCQQVEDQLTPAQRSIFHTIEQDLRAAVIKAGHITAPRLDRALLLSCG
jgi:hypothetical protein